MSGGGEVSSEGGFFGSVSIRSFFVFGNSREQLFPT
jgi:hypothetical protein